MADLYLIAHCVRGEAAFDVAEQMPCPHCNPQWSEKVHGCFDCDDLGFWWIIPTSGHRAWPYWFGELRVGAYMSIEATLVPEMPTGWPDHFKTLPAPKVDITSLFKREAKPHIARRL